MTKKNTVLLIPYEKRRKGFVDAEALYNIILDSRDLALEQKVGELSVVSIGSIEVGYLRKRSEAV